MVDIHSHVLPIIDDGSGSIEESLAMLRIAESNDLRHIVASSHGNRYVYSLEQYEEAFNMLQTESIRHGINVKLYPGMEILLDDYAIEKIKNKELLTINNTDYILAEVPFDADVNYIDYYLTKLLEMGYRVILAHPERYHCFQKGPSLAWKLVSKGCYLQINYGSLIGLFGQESKMCAEQLIDMDMVHIIATDAHDTKYRSQNLKPLMAMLRSEYSPEEIKLWLSENPSRVLKGMDLLSMIDIR